MDDDDKGIDEAFAEDNSMGFKLQQFYIALRSLDSADIAWYLSLVETHIPDLTIGETSAIIKELILDCQSKCTQYFRAVYGEQIRNLIASSRKKIHSKAAIEIHASTQHHQRHIVILIDLLGSWSNMVLEMTNLGLSPKVRQMIALPLHGRIREMVLEIFKAFKEDKNLDQLQSRILSHQDQVLKLKGNIMSNNSNNHNSNATTSSSSYRAPVSFSTLDQILIQLTTIRETVTQYYSFLRAHLLAINTSSSSSSDTPSDETEDNGSLDTLSNTSSSSSSNVTENQMVSVLNEVNIDWRESDAYYISLEYGYITEALTDALSCGALLETENMTFIPQSIEDAFFLFRRISERSIIGFNEQTIFAIANKIIELVDPFQDSNMYMIVSEKKYFFNCTSRRSIIVPDSLKITNHHHHHHEYSTTSSSSIRGEEEIKSNLKTSVSLSDTRSTHKSSSNIPASTSSSASVLPGTNNNTSDNTVSSSSTNPNPTDLGSWLVQALQDEVDTYEEQKAIKSISSGASEGPSTTSLLMATGFNFLQQLVGDDSDEEDARQREHLHRMSVQQATAGNISFSDGSSGLESSNSNSSIISGGVDEGMDDSIASRMKLVDLCVYVSALATCITSIQSLRSFHSQTVTFLHDMKLTQQQQSANLMSTKSPPRSNNNGVSSSNPLLLVQQELLRCARGYHSLYQRDLRELAALVFAQTFLPQLRSYFHTHR